MKKTRKILSLALALIMLVSVLSMSVSATNPTALSGFGSDVGSISVSGADVTGVNLETASSNNGNADNTTYTYTITLGSSTNSSAVVTATFAKASGSSCTISAAPRMSAQPVPTIPVVQQNQSLVYSCTLSGGNGSATAYVFPNLTGDFTRFDTYVFNYSTNYPVSISTGDPVHIEWNNNTGVVTGDVDSDAIPANFTLWVDGASTITVDGQTQSYTYQDGNSSNYAFTITTKTTSMTIVAVTGGTTYTITCPARNASTPAGSSPSSVVSYLPIGQYATGTGWGSSAGKFVNKTTLDSTGVSLGALGGYIEYYFENGISNNANNPFGVDFVVYGNAFSGNPEPGAVQVSVDGKEWYELAGSLYYQGGFAATGATQQNGKFANGYIGTLRNATATYTLNSNNIAATMSGVGGSITASPFTNAVAWWPSASNYPMGGAYNNTGSNISVNFGSNQLSFGGITAIQDSNSTAFYAFGYADVTPNGSPSQYGAAVNPYTPYTSAKTGGDGFDLAWAVDIATGEPVNLSTVYYVRIYSAVLDNSTFGETSPEICGIFTAQSGSTNQGTTGFATISASSGSLSNAIKKANVLKQTTITVDAGVNSTTLNISSGADYFLVKDTAVTGGSTSVVVNRADGATQYFRVITQTGNKQASIAIVKVIFA